MAREIDEAWIEQAVERYRRIESRQAEFDRVARGVEVTVRSPDDAIEVVVTADGVIKSVRILVPLRGWQASDLSRSVTSAVAAAGEAAAWARQKLHDETFGDYPSLGES